MNDLNELKIEFKEFMNQFQHTYDEFYNILEKIDYLKEILEIYDFIDNYTTLNQQFQFIFCYLNASSDQERKIISYSFKQNCKKKIEFQDFNNFCIKNFNYVLLSIKVIHLNILNQVYESFQNGIISQEEFVYNIKLQKSIQDGIIDQLPRIINFDKNKIFFQDKNSSQWQKILRQMEFRKVGSDEQIQSLFYLTLLESQKDFEKIIYFTYGFVSRMQNFESHFIKQILICINAPYSFFNLSQVSKDALLFYSHPTIKLASQVWNVASDNLLVSIGATILMPRIKYHKIFQIKHNYIQIDEQKINDLCSSNNFQHNQCFKSKSQMSDNIQIRVLSNQPLSQVKKSSIIVHIHGGGFISTDTFIHQSVTRQIANQTKCPVFSIEYDLSPKNQFPWALNQIWQSYLYLIDNSEKEFGIQIEKIILAGDSAGGNLCLALTILTIKMGARIPDGLFLAYAALNLDANSTFVPSFCKALTDSLIPHKLIRLCLNSYFDSQKFDPQTNYFISPFVVNDEILGYFPNMRMYVGDQDILYDHHLEFFQRIVEFNKKSKLSIYERLSHGFLSQSYPLYSQEFLQCLYDACDSINELINEL